MENGVFSLPIIFASIPFSFKIFSIFLEIKIKLFSLLDLFKESLSTISLRGSGFNCAKDKSSNSSRIGSFPYDQLKEHIFP